MKRGLFTELKRRNVLRAATFYAASAWLLVQIVTQVGPVFDLPPATQRWIIVAALIGFPFAMAFSWFYEWTPQGIQLESEVSQDASIARETGKKLDRWIITVLSLAVVLLLADRFVPHREPAAVAVQTPGKSIAVLPFENLSDDKGNAYFSDGITEEILDALAKIPNLKVAARSSAFQFRSGKQDLRKAGLTLGVANILEGGVQKAGDQVRINVQLVDAQSGLQLWSQKYDRKLDNVFAVEDDISKSIATQLRVQLTGGGGQPLVSGGTNNTAAHELYLRGLPLIAARGPKLRDAAADFQQAVALDPDYAQAWAALAETQMLLPHYFLESQDTAFPAGEAAARRALALDPDTAAAHAALGMLYRIQWKWAEADSAFQRAVKLAPGDAEVADQYGQFLLAEGRLPASLAEIERAQKLDPLSGIIAVTRINVLTALHRFGDADAQTRSMIEGHPDYALGQYLAADVAVLRRDFPDAKIRFEAGAKLTGESPNIYLQLVDAVADPAKRADAVRAVLAATDDPHQRLTEPARIKWLMLLDAHDDALAALQRIEHDIMFGQDNVWQPAFDPVRGDPRFKAALTRMGLALTADTGAAP
ncbi:MAG TPA: tetratricopeptide repeat protein [Rudaea sp.]|nr:tetratricopeptide repeat protein [Rudaea sp.]